MKKYRSVWVLIISMFFMASAYTMLIPFLPLYLLELGGKSGPCPLMDGTRFFFRFFCSGNHGACMG